MIEIDGSYGEGGGQVLRTALTLAALTHQPTRVCRIRAGRRNPGLAPQHVAGVLALGCICDAETSEIGIGCSELVFVPRSRPRCGEYVFDVAQSTCGGSGGPLSLRSPPRKARGLRRAVRGQGSAGAVSLILQTVMLPLACAEGASRVVLRGGTHVPWSPPYEYVEEVFLPALAQLGHTATSRLDSPGFYPVGGGQITVEVAGAFGNPSRRAPLSMIERGMPKHVRGDAVACNLPAHIAQRIADRAHNVLSRAGLRAEITPRLTRGAGPGAYLWLLAEYEHGMAGFCALGEKGKPSERVTDEACQALLAHHAQGAPIDPHLADQLLLPLALAASRSEFRTSRITSHLLTNAHVIRQFVPAGIEITGREGEPGAIVVHGIGTL